MFETILNENGVISKQSRQNASFPKLVNRIFVYEIISQARAHEEE